jgi:hypothetical protein
MREIAELEALGYSFTVTDGRIRYSHIGNAPAPSAVRPLLDALRTRKAEAIAYLQCSRTPAEQAGVRPGWDEPSAVIGERDARGAHCGACHGVDFWFNFAGEGVCWTCHPPAAQVAHQLAQRAGVSVAVWSGGRLA